MNIPVIPNSKYSNEYTNSGRYTELHNVKIQQPNKRSILPNQNSINKMCNINLNSFNIGIKYAI